ncbi:septum formation initiator [Thermincola ferriacetica]|uniref:Cell division protein FtsL n=1 Tax=Thermincola ferriacetica TaxID=281456 RepID=A0A0L6W544_9FIRM|nr:septum formation initiator family protein [Thermincola ferriacetica]KNZ70478.1 septum formation initiator [Thermincola ferriacetica]
MILARESHDYYRYQEQTAVRPRRTRKVRRMRNKSRLVYTGIMMIAFTVFLLLATKYAQIAATGYKIVEMKKQIKAMELQNQALEMKIAQLQSLERIEAVATEKLGMVKPDTSAGVQFVAVESKDSVGKEQVPAQKIQKEEQLKPQKEKHRPMALIDVLSRLLANWTGRVAQAEATTASN